MRKFHLSAATALSTAFLLGVSTPASAQDTGPSKATKDEGTGDIIVTARRSEERLQDVPISISVLSQATLSNANIGSTSELGALVPSLEVNQQFGPEKASFEIRGFVQQYHTAPTVGVYFADVIAPRADGPTTSGNGAGIGSMFDLQNVQVLKGPQGTLFGRGTDGGAILLVPQKPTDKLEGYVEGSAGSYNMHRIQAVLNVPLSDTFRIRGGVDWNQRDGYIINHSGIGPNDFDNVDYLAARLSIVGDLTPDLENYTIFSYSRSKTHGDAEKLLICNQAASNAFYQGNAANLLDAASCAQVARENAYGPWGVENNLPNAGEFIEQWQGINTTTWKASDTLTVKNIISYAEYFEKSNFNLWGDNLLMPPGLPGAGSLIVNALNLETGLSPWTTAQSTFTEELQFQGRSANGRFNWQAGGYLELSNPLGWNSQLVGNFVDCANIQALDCTNPFGIGSISDSNTKDKFRNYGLYAQATYKVTDKFSVTGGFRYSINRQTDLAENLNISVANPYFYYPPIYGGGKGYPTTGVFNCQNVVQLNSGYVNGIPQPLIVPGSQPNLCDLTFKENSNKPTWLIDFDYKATDDIMIYAKYARGLREGSITSNSVGFEVVKPEKVDAFEVGAKTSFRGAVPGYFNIAGFYNDFHNQQLAIDTDVALAFAGVITPASPTVNAGHSRMWGVEVDTSVRPFKGLKLDAAYTYLNTRLLALTLPTAPIYYSNLVATSNVGGPLQLSPKNRYTLTGTYTFPLDNSIGKVSVGATFIHSDSSQAALPSFTPLYLIAPENQLNLNASWNSMLGKPVDLSFFMTNATNEARMLFPGQSYTYFGADGGHMNQPRMWGFSLKYHFGG